eukprot:TRINITY_DN3127_c0_g1_i4.p2 TRINITY_DN3127_c0_g1~~TRINITY_DN3127_c0_g1_i4.p2  ORF type:complete len:344 (+),score=77.83 TRINITY_DN3127_c0_g1_i4:101-1132(+)
MALLKDIESFKKEGLQPTTTVVQQMPVVPFGSRDDPTAAPTADEVVEYYDTDEEVDAKVRAFADLLKASKHCVVFTGAGISTAAKIPDYRGPNGVWTLRAQGLAPKVKVTLDQAVPTYSHMALVELMRRGLVHYIVSTNVDGLHLRAGVPQDKLSELHGNIYLEVCTKCNATHLRLFDVRGQHKRQFVQAKRNTGRLCESKMDDGSVCLGLLRDSIVNFGENLPERDLSEGICQAKQADLTLVMGSSMRVSPACKLPSYSYKRGGKFCLCNLQKTHYDKYCTRHDGVRVFARTDVFMRQLMRLLGIEVPSYKADVTEDTVAKAYASLILDPTCDEPLKKARRA